MSFFHWCSSADYGLRKTTENKTTAGEDRVFTVSARNGVGSTVNMWLKPAVVDTITLSASASCRSGAVDAFARELLVKVSLTCVVISIRYAVTGDFL